MLTHQLVLLNWQAVDLVRDSVSKNAVESQEDISFTGFTMYLKMYTFTHTHSYEHTYTWIQTCPSAPHTQHCL